MADEPNPNPEPTLTEPLGNSETSRNPDGSLKDTQAAPTTTPSSDSPPNSTEPTPPKQAEPPAGAPEKYADFKAPEGFELDAKAIEGALPLFKEMNLSQDQAQRLVDFYAEQSKQAAEAPMQFYEEMRGKWRDEITNSNLGNRAGDLSAETNQNISAAIDSLPQDLIEPFKEALNLTGAGDHPAIVRALNALGAHLREGTAVAGRGPSPNGQIDPSKGSGRSAASILFPNLPSASG